MVAQNKAVFLIDILRTVTEAEKGAFQKVNRIYLFMLPIFAVILYILYLCIKSGYLFKKPFYSIAAYFTLIICHYISANAFYIPHINIESILYSSINKYLGL